jgi:hypothetical protein
MSEMATLALVSQRGLRPQPKSQASSYKLQAASFKLQASSFKWLPEIFAGRQETRKS